jgi:two-component system OmpR family response regulator
MKQVLVVDDTKNIRNMLSTCLEMEGYHVTAAADGNEALRLFQAERFDLAFLDIKLPELSGTSVLQRIRAMGIMTPVIIMTAFATVRNAVECTKLGAVAYLQKPFTAERVRQVVKEIGAAATGESLEDYLRESAALLAGNQPEQALAILKQALALDPACGEVYRLLAGVYQAQGNAIEAERFRAIAAKFQ